MLEKCKRKRNRRMCAQRREAEQQTQGCEYMVMSPSTMVSPWPVLPLGILCLAPWPCKGRDRLPQKTWSVLLPKEMWMSGGFEELVWSHLIWTT